MRRNAALSRMRARCWLNSRNLPPTQRITSNSPSPKHRPRSWTLSSFSVSGWKPPLKKIWLAIGKVPGPEGMSGLWHQIGRVTWLYAARAAR